MTTSLAGDITANLSGDNSGQIAVGANIAQYNLEHGAVLYNLAPGEVPVATRRVPAPRITGRRPPAPLGREAEAADAIASLGQASAMEFVGPPGVGKTTLLKHVVHQAPLPADADGIVYREVPSGEAVRDTIQFLWNAFYSTNVAFVPTDAQLLLDLRGIRAVVVLDDFERDRSDVARVLDALPDASFLFASSRRALWGDGRSVSLPGLEEDAAVAVLERGFGRSLDDNDRAAAAVIAETLDGQPLALLHAASLAARLGLGLAQLGDDDLREGSAADAIARRLIGSLGDDERKVLELLATLAGATLPARELAELTGVDDAGPVVESLLKLGLIQAHSPRYSATAAAVVQTPAPATVHWTAVARGYFTDWTERHQRHPAVVLEEEQAVMAVLRSAAADGEWDDVVRIGRALEGPLMLGGRWGGWQEVLDLELTGARRLGDRAAEAWVLHQTGSRALGLGDADMARANLTEALTIREGLGDADGAAVTRHNLDLLGGGPPPPPPRRSPTWKSILRPPLALLLALVLVGGGLVAWVLWPSDDVVAFELRVEPSRLDFGDQATDTRSSPRSVTVTNDGDREVAVGGVALGGDGASAYRAGDGCQGVVLGAGASCAIDVVFEPPGVGGEKAELVVAGPEGDESVVALVGTGIGAASTFDLELIPTSIDFEPVEIGQTSKPRSLTVRNTGTSDLDLRHSVEGEDANFSVTDSAGKPCPDTLPAGGRCEVDVTYAPVKGGRHLGAVVIGSSPSGVTARATLTGTGEDPSDPAPTCDLSVPSDPQTVVIKSPVTLEVSGKARSRPTLTASGIPAGLAFRDHNDGTGVITGVVSAPPGDVPITIVCGAGGSLVSKTFTLRIVSPRLVVRSAPALAQLLLGVGAAMALGARPARRRERRT